MSTIIAAGVDDLPCFLAFYFYDPLYLFVCFLYGEPCIPHQRKGSDIHNMHPDCLLLKCPVAISLHFSALFNLLYSITNEEQYKEHLCASATNSVAMERND